MVNSSILLNKINNRKIIKNLGQFVSIIIITLLAVCLAVGLNSSAQTLEKKLDLLLDETNFADGYLYSAGNYSEDNYNIGISKEFFEEIKKDTTEAQRRLEFTSLINGVETKVLSYEEKAEINMPYVEQYTSGIYLSSSIAEKNELTVGDTVSLTFEYGGLTELLEGYDLSFLDKYLQEGKENPFLNDSLQLDFKLSGIMYHNEAITETNVLLMEQSHLKESLNNTIEEYFTNTSTLNSVLNTILDDLYVSVVFKGDIDLVKEKYNSDTTMVISSEFNKDLMLLRNDIEQAYQLTYVFPVIFIIVSILIIITTISQLIFKKN